MSEEELSRAIKEKVSELNKLISKANGLGLTVFVSNDPMVTKATVAIKKFAPVIEY